MRPICVACMVFFKPKKNGVAIEAGDRIWAADLYECPGCGTQLVTGFSREPIAESYQPHYETVRQRSMGQVTV